MWVYAGIGSANGCTVHELLEKFGKFHSFDFDGGIVSNYYSEFLSKCRGQISKLKNLSQFWPLTSIPYISFHEKSVWIQYAATFRFERNQKIYQAKISKWTWNIENFANDDDVLHFRDIFVILNSIQDSLSSEFANALNANSGLPLLYGGRHIYWFTMQNTIVGLMVWATRNEPFQLPKVFFFLYALFMCSLCALRLHCDHQVRSNCSSYTSTVPVPWLWTGYQ